MGKYPIQHQLKYQQPVEPNKLCLKIHPKQNKKQNLITFINLKKYEID